MAITSLDGKLLQADLLRGTVDLSVASGLIHFDVNTNTVNVGTQTPIADTQFQVAGTGSSIFPKGTTLERPLVQVPGMIRYNTDANGYEYWNATEWLDIGNVYSAVAGDVFTGTTDTVYTLGTIQTNSSVIVSINGIVQIPVTSYSIVGVLLTLTDAPLMTDVIDVRSFRTTTSLNEITDGTSSLAANNTQLDLTGHIVPTVDITYDLGSLTNRFRDLYLSGATLDLGGLKLKNVAGEFAFTEADGLTPASINATVTDIDGGTY